MARDPFVTEAKAKRIINALHATGINIASVTVTADGVTFHTSANTERSADSKQPHLPEDWGVWHLDVGRMTQNLRAIPDIETGQIDRHLDAMKIEFKGLLRERRPSGNIRYRVRVEGDPIKKITLSVDPSSPEFVDHYKAARRGFKVEQDKPPEDMFAAGSISWLATKHLTWLEQEVERGIQSPKTLKKRRMMLGKLTDLAGDKSFNVPATSLVKFRDRFSATPIMADDMIAAIRVMFDWGLQRGYCQHNPAKGIPNIGKRGTGAKPWTLEDINAFKAHHKPGSMAHLCLTLLTFTACRIGDARLLGRHNEVMKNGVAYIEWQPEKKNAAFVSIPMAPQLRQAIAETKFAGATYMINPRGKPFASADAMSPRFSKWCREAGLEGKTAHGVRKAVGYLLAEAGRTQYQIMAVHGHTESRTSEVYTKGVERPELARQAIEALAEMEW